MLTGWLAAGWWSRYTVFMAAQLWAGSWARVDQPARVKMWPNVKFVNFVKPVGGNRFYT